MAVNMERMMKKREEAQTDGEFWKPEEGDTNVMVLPASREDDEWEPTAGLVYLPIVIHYNVGKDSKMVVCLDAAKNPIVSHPFFLEALKERNVKITTDECPVCAARASGEMDDDAVAESKPQTRYLWVVLPVAFRGLRDKNWTPVSPRPAPYLCGKTIYDGFMEVFADNGDITDFDATILVKVNRTGKGPTDTKYKVQPDVVSIKKPLSIDEDLRALVMDAVKPGGSCDPFKIAANLTKSNVEVRALLAGVAVETDDDPPADEPKAAPAKAPAKPAPAAKPVAKAAPAAVAAAPAKPASKPAPAAAPVAKAAAPAAKAPAAAAPKAPAAAAPKAAPAKPAPAAKKPAPPPVEEAPAEDEEAPAEEELEETPAEEAEETPAEEAAEPAAADELDDLEAELAAASASKKKAAAARK